MRNHFQLFSKLTPGDLSLILFTKFLYLMLVQCYRRKFRSYYELWNFELICKKWNSLYPRIRCQNSFRIDILSTRATLFDTICPNWPLVGELISFHFGTFFRVAHANFKQFGDFLTCFQEFLTQFALADHSLGNC